MPVAAHGVWRQAVDRRGKDVKRVGISTKRKDNFHQVRMLMLNLLSLDPIRQEGENSRPFRNESAGISPTPSRQGQQFLAADEGYFGASVQIMRRPWWTGGGLDLRHVGQLGQHVVDHLAAFVDVGQLAAADTPP